MSDPKWSNLNTASTKEIANAILNSSLQAIRERVDEIANRNVAEMEPRELEDVFEQMVRDANTLIAIILEITEPLERT